MTSVKFGIPDNILTKKGRLTDEEYANIKFHTIIGANILSVADIFKEVSVIIKSHHERMDGKGYPDNLVGDQIPYLSKILCICDSFDAITSKRSYKEINSIDFAIEELIKGKGTQFDSKLTDIFLDLIYKDKDNFIVNI